MGMPIGVIVNVAAVAIGGLLGTVLKKWINARLKKGLTLIFSICAAGLGITSAVKIENMSAVILALVLGTAIGLILRLGDRIDQGAAALQKITARLQKKDGESSNDLLFTTAIVLFCAGGTGIYGALVSGMNGDHSILLAKAILDLFTAAIFACSLGPATSLIAIPQLIILLILYFCAGLIYPLTTATMINDFMGCGGLILVATSPRIAEIKNYPVADMIPAMILVMPISSLWTNVIAPLLG